MGKKSKGNKLAKMSEEERARYLQMRADIEEETRRRKIQLLSLYMKNKLKKEDAFCRLNMAKINQEWRSILRQVKCQDLRKEMLEVEQFFKDAIDRKNQRIDKLMNDLDIAEDMYGTLQQAHMAVIGKLINIQRDRIAYLNNFYETERNTLLGEFSEDMDKFKEASSKSQEQLESVMFQLEDQGIKMQVECDEDYLKKVDDLNGTMQYRLEEITKKGEAKLERLWSEYQKVLSGYVKHTESFYAEYMDLKERDEESSALIKENCSEIQKATEQIAFLKLVAADEAEKNQMKINFLEKVRNDLSTRLTELRDRVDKEMSESEEKFKVMSVESHEVLKDIKKILARGEKLLQMFAICRKFESEREKILPFGLPPLPRKMLHIKDEDASRQEATSEGNEEDPFSYLKEMEIFWKRVNNVTTDVCCLRDHKKVLEEENARLKEAIQEHLINLNISNGCNNHVNDYLAKRPSSMRVDRVTQAPFISKKVKSADIRRLRSLANPATYVEANMTSTVRSRELVKNKPKLGQISYKVLIHRGF